MDFENPQRYKFSPHMGATPDPQGQIVKYETYAALLAAYKETRLALEIGARHEFYETWHPADWISEARTELSKPSERTK